MHLILIVSHTRIDLSPFNIQIVLKQSLWFKAHFKIYLLNGRIIWANIYGASSLRFCTNPQVLYVQQIKLPTPFLEFMV